MWRSCQAFLWFAPAALSISLFSNHNHWSVLSTRPYNQATLSLETHTGVWPTEASWPLQWPFLAGRALSGQSMAPGRPQECRAAHIHWLVPSASRLTAPANRTITGSTASSLTFLRVFLSPAQSRDSAHRARPNLGICEDSWSEAGGVGKRHITWGGRRMCHHPHHALHTFNYYPLRFKE